MISSIDDDFKLLHQIAQRQFGINLGSREWMMLQSVFSEFCNVKCGADISYSDVLEKKDQRIKELEALVAQTVKEFKL